MHLHLVIPPPRVFVKPDHSGRPLKWDVVFLQGFINEDYNSPFFQARYLRVSYPKVSLNRRR